MKKLASIFMLISAFSLSLAASQEKDIKAPIRQVTVYPDRAQVAHESPVDLPAGTTILHFAGLSPYIDPQSIQVKGSGDFIIMSVSHRNNYLQNLEDLPEVKNIRDQIQALQLKVEDEKTAITVLQEKEAFLVANRAIPGKESTFSSEQLKSVMDFYTNSMEQVKNTVLKKTRLIKDYEKQIAALQKQISDKFGRQQLPSGVIDVSVSSSRTIPGKIFLSYVVGNAGWFPSYDIRVEDIDTPVTLFYKANVYQNTGVRWENVKMSFSNATPWISGNIPELNTWFIDFFNPEPRPPVTLRSKAYGVNRPDQPVMAEMDAAMKGGEMTEVSAMPAPVEKKPGETTVTFDISTPFTLEPDGKTQTIEIQRATTTAEFKYLTVPKLSPMAYLTGNISNWEKQGLISGEATLYFENTFVGKSLLNVNQLTDTLAVSLGTDNGILVKREKRQDFTSKKTLGSNKTETFSFLITLRSNKKSAIKISVHDQLPVSTNSSIEVSAIELSGARYNNKTGEVTWDIELQPQENRQLVLTYSVKHPKDKTIILE